MKFEFILSNTKKQKEMINSNDRLHFHQKARMTSNLRSLGKFEAREAEKNCFSSKRPCNVLVTVFSPTKRRLDPPNLYPTIKALVDGFTDAGIWTDDNHEIIKSMTFKYGGLSGIKSKYKIKIEIKECK